MAEPALTLYQAEWCPFSSAVREVLTELGLDFVARQVEPWPEQREGLQALAGTDQIPVLQAEDGELYRGTRAIFDHLREREPGPFAAAHRSRFADHRDARESDATGQLIEYFRGTDELQTGEGTPAEAEVVDVPEKNRYELRLGDRLHEGDHTVIGRLREPVGVHLPQLRQPLVPQLGVPRVLVAVGAEADLHVHLGDGRHPAAERLEQTHLHPLVVADTARRLLDAEQSRELAPVPRCKRRAGRREIAHGRGW